MAKIWITFRTGNGAKLLGQVEEEDFDKVGSNVLKIYNPMASYTVSEKGAIEGSPTNLTTRIQPLLEPMDSEEDFHFYNTQVFVCWQKITGQKTINTMEDILQKIAENKKTLKNDD